MLCLVRLLLFVFLLLIAPAKLLRLPLLVQAKTPLSNTSSNHRNHERFHSLRRRINNLAKSIRSKIKIQLPRNPFRKKIIDDSVFGELTPSSRKGPLVLARAVSWLLTNTVRSKLIDSKGLKISVDSHSNKLIAKGEFGAIRMTFESIKHSQLTVSGGGFFEIEGLHFRIHRFLFMNRQAVIVHPYKISCHLTLTPDDVMASPYIRLIFQSAVDTVLARVLNSGVLNVTVHSVSMKDQRLYARGSITLLADNNSPIANAIVSAVTGRGSFNANPYSRIFTGYSYASEIYPQESSEVKEGAMNINFEISTHIGVMADKASVLYLKDVAVVLNPDSSVMRTNLPIPTSAIIEINLGAQSEVHQLTVGDGKVVFAASAMVLPSRSLDVADGVSGVVELAEDESEISLVDTIEGIATAVIDAVSAVASASVEQLTTTASMLINTIISSSCYCFDVTGWVSTDTQTNDVRLTSSFNPPKVESVDNIRVVNHSNGDGDISSGAGICSSSTSSGWFWSNTIYHYDISSVLSEMLQINGGWLTSRLPILRILRAQKYD